MTNYNSVLSDDKIQKVFDKLQPLDADFISFGDFLFGCCIVSFKQNSGGFYKSGSILIDENGEIIPITISSGKSYDGLDSIKPEKEGSSLLQLGYNVTVDVSLEDDYPIRLKLVAHDEIGGTYQVENLDGFNEDVWLCNVVHFLFGEHPEEFYFNVK